MPQPICPKCFNGFVKRSRRRGPLDRLASLFKVFPYRCQLCQHRFHIRETALRFQRVDEDRRDYTRWPVNLTTAFASRNTRGHATLLDLSMAGCSLQTDATLQTGNILDLDIQLPEGSTVRVAVAILRRATPGLANIEFLHLAPEEREKLRAFVRGLIPDSSEPPR